MPAADPAGRTVVPLDRVSGWLSGCSDPETGAAGKGPGLKPGDAECRSAPLEACGTVPQLPGAGRAGGSLFPQQHLDPGAKLPVSKEMGQCHHAGGANALLAFKKVEKVIWTMPALLAQGL